MIEGVAKGIKALNHEEHEGHKGKEKLFFVLFVFFVVPFFSEPFAMASFEGSVKTQITPLPVILAKVGIHLPAQKSPTN